MAKVTLDLDTVIFYNIELNDVYHEDETEEIAKANTDFIDNIIVPEVLRRVKQCECNHTRPVENLTQNTIDSYEYSVIVFSENGKYTAIASIIMCCKKCGLVKTFALNGVEMFARQYAEGINDFATNTYNDPIDDTEEVDVEDLGIIDQLIKDNDLIIEDVECTPVDDKKTGED